MGKAFSTGAEPLDWIYLANMLMAQSGSNLANVLDVASSVSPCTVNIVLGEVFGGYSVVIVEYQDFNYVSIVGTQSIAEAMLDILGAPLAPAPWLNEPFRGDVVLFFYTNALFLAASVQSVLKNENPSVFAGHSLGGASCQIMAGMLSALGRRIIGCFTIGSPKPGSVNFANSLTFPVMNVEAVGDVIPSLPQIIKVPGVPWWLNIVAKALGNASIWFQTGLLLTLGDDGSLKADGGQQYGQLKILSLLNQAGSGTQGYFEKHQILNYLSNFSVGHPTKQELMPCASGYQKPWRLFLRDDPVFPPQPPAKLAPCVPPSQVNTVFVYKVDYQGNATLLGHVDDPPPTYPLPSNQAAASPCCKPKTP